MTTRVWISVALLALLAPTALATGRKIDFEVAAKADLQVETRADAGYRYTWDWGDGGTGVGARTRHTYERPGVYKVVVVAVDDAGHEYRRTREVEVKAERPSASHDIDVETEGDRVRVDAEYEARARYEWDWGDGHHTRGRHATHVYTEPGTYEVELKVTHADGSCSYERRTVVARGDVDEDDRTTHRHSTRVRSPGIGVSVGLGHGHPHDDEVARDDRYEWRSDTSVSSSSYSHNDVPGFGAPLVAAALAGSALVVRALRRR